MRVFFPWILSNTVHVILSIKCLKWGGFVLGGFVVRWVCLGWICLGWVCLGWVCQGWVCRSVVLSGVGLSVYPFLSVLLPVFFNLSRTCPYIRTYETYRKYQKINFCRRTQRTFFLQLFSTKVKVKVYLISAVL